ncbi:MAG: DUF1570 domain-containing protein [Pirellulaceae bacterium]|nr:DUF1570 domain-containing protein [Pirellulaceae bacterium]
MLVCRSLSILLAAAQFAGVAGAEERTVDPRPFGFDLAPGALRAGKGEIVTTSDAAGQPAMGRIHARIGEGAVILLPDGQLVARPAGQFAPSDRPFQPLDKDALKARLLEEFPGFKVAHTGHYVYVYDSSEEFALATSRILETMLSDKTGLKAFAENQKLTVHEPATLLVAVMFRTDEEFQRYRRMPDGVVAYYHTLSNRVFMYEQAANGGARADLALQQSIATIAHEGAHQILHNIGVQQRLSLWPMWLSEGLAEYCAPTSTDARLRWKGVGVVNDMRMFELEQYIKSNAAAPPSGELIDHTVLAARLTSTGYATAWSVVHYLAKNKRAEFAAYLREVAALGPFEGATEITPPGIVRGNRALFIKHFGDDFAGLETKLVLHLKKQPYADPFAGAPHLVATLLAGDARRPQRQANTFHSRELAEKWLDDSLAKLPADQRASATPALRLFPNRAAAENYARQWLAGK